MAFHVHARDPLWHSSHYTLLSLGLCLQNVEAEKGHFMYAHEIAGGTIPEIARTLHIPRYFINNYGDVTPGANITVDKMVAETHFPAFFFGSQGSNSPLHSDGALLIVLWVSLTRLARSLMSSTMLYSACSDVLQRMLCSMHAALLDHVLRVGNLCS